MTDSQPKPWKLKKNCVTLSALNFIFDALTNTRAKFLLLLMLYGRRTAAYQMQRLKINIRSDCTYTNHPPSSDYLLKPPQHLVKYYPSRLQRCPLQLINNSLAADAFPIKTELVFLFVASSHYYSCVFQKCRAFIAPVFIFAVPAGWRVIMGITSVLDYLGGEIELFRFICADFVFLYDPTKREGLLQCNCHTDIFISASALYNSPL